MADRNCFPPWLQQWPSAVPVTDARSSHSAQVRSLQGGPNHKLRPGLGYNSGRSGLLPADLWPAALRSDACLADGNQL